MADQVIQEILRSISELRAELSDQIHALDDRLRQVEIGLADLRARLYLLGGLAAVLMPLLSGLIALFVEKLVG